MQVTWDGNQIADEVNFTSTDWVRFSFTEVATSDLTVISFSGNSAQFLGLDNVNVEATPEPTTMIVWGLLGMVVAGYGVVRRRRAA
jgi:MYXO-CTERM domain-containing protein